MLEPCRDDRGQKRKRLAVRSRQQEREDGELGEVELEIPYHPLEGGIRHLHVGKIEGQIVRADRAALHCTGHADDHRGECGVWRARQSSGPSTYFRPLSSSALRMP